jgi:hypothetical protein
VQGQFEEASAKLEPCTRALETGGVGHLSPDEISGVCAWADCQVKVGSIDAAVRILERLVAACQVRGIDNTAPSPHFI